MDALHFASSAQHNDNAQYFYWSTWPTLSSDHYFFTCSLSSTVGKCSNGIMLTHQARAEKVVISFTLGVRPFVRPLQKIKSETTLRRGLVVDWICYTCYFCYWRYWPIGSLTNLILANFFFHQHCFRLLFQYALYRSPYFTRLIKYLLLILLPIWTQ